jgi:hypothetical protein
MSTLELEAPTALPRVYLTPAQAGAGYLYGVSVIRRFTQ